MTLTRRLCSSFALLLLLSGSPALAQQPPAQPQQQSEFVPIDQLPPQDQLPAAPLLISAYAVVLVAFFAYVMSVGKRLGSVQRELERLESDMQRNRRS